MTTQTELEKTQLEIARLQVEQERVKLQQMQKRQKVVDGLGQGAAAMGGAARGGTRWLLCVALGAVGGAVACAAVVTLIMTIETARGGTRVCARFADADFLYRLGCEFGANSAALFGALAAGVLAGMYYGHKAASGQ